MRPRLQSRTRRWPAKILLQAFFACVKADVTLNNL